MEAPYQVVDQAIAELDKLRKFLRLQKSKQIRTAKEIQIIKSTVNSWFTNFRPNLPPIPELKLLANIDRNYTDILNLTEKQGARSKYVEKLKETKTDLMHLRAEVITFQTSQASSPEDSPPNFSPLIADPRMRTILENRWGECNRCISSDAPLAATVMMGGLLEALFLTRINVEVNKKYIFTATNAPRDKTTGKVLPLKEWSLKNYIDVAFEIKWISQSAKDVSDVLRDYRNYIHPYKEFSHGAELSKKDAMVLWGITKTLTGQILSSI